MVSFHAEDEAILQHLVKRRDSLMRLGCHFSGGPTVREMDGSDAD